MFDSRIAIEEVSADVTAEEMAEMNAYHDACDAEWREREDLACSISDFSKDVQGFRVRIPWMTMTMRDLRAEYTYWSVELGRCIERDAEEEWYDSITPPLEAAPVCEYDELYHTMGW